MIARRRRKIFGGIIVFYMDFYDIFVRFGGVFNAILKDLYSKMRYKIPKKIPPGGGQIIENAMNCKYDTQKTPPLFIQIWEN